MPNIGINISIRRRELGLTQEELAKRVGYKSKSTINKIELGKNDIPQSKILKFAEALETTPKSLMGWETAEERKKPTDTDDGLSEDIMKLVEFARSVPEDKAAMILKVMQSIVEAD